MPESGKPRFACQEISKCDSPAGSGFQHPHDRHKMNTTRKYDLITASLQGDEVISSPIGDIELIGT